MTDRTSVALWSFGFLGLFRTVCIDVQSVADRLPAELLADSIAQLDHVLVGELDQLARPHADHLVLRLATVDEPVVRLLRVKEGLGDDPCLGKQDDGSIDGRLGDTMRASGHLEKDLLDLEDLVSVDDRIEDRCAFWGVLEAA